MAKKGKMKISKLKRNNHTTNKMKKAGQLRLQRHRSKVQKQKPQAQPQVEYSSDSDSASGDEWADMLDKDEQKYIMKHLAKNPKMLSSVPERDLGESKPKKRKRSREDKPKPPSTQLDSGADTDSDASTSSEVEDKYEKEQAERPAKRMRSLLPIKTKQGLFERAEECKEEEESETEAQPSRKPDPDPVPSDSDSGMEGTEEEEPSESRDDEVVTTVQLLAARRDTLNKEKLRIGALCSSLLESPEKKLKNFYPILYLMESHLKDGTANLHSVRKLATLSAFEVFKDILPDYQIRHQDYSNVKLKKDTLSLYKYEKELLEFYKRYLQRLEKATAVLRPKKGDTRKPDESALSLALVSLNCMSGLLAARPQFNYSSNIAQSVIPLLGSKHELARRSVAEACCTVFNEDKKGEVTLTIVRLINQLVKKRGDRLPPSALDCLLSLRIKDIELDAETDLKQKQKQEEKHKKRIVNLSKKEKKRAKKLKEVERELLETQAQESEIAHNKQMTEVTKTVFQIYFRILKTAPHSKLLIAVLNGLAKFTHVINLEYYSELVAILARLITDDAIGAREKLQCVNTSLAVLSGAGDALTIDPMRFHAYAYGNMLDVHAGRSHENARLILSVVQQICARARSVTSSVLQAFAKRLASVALQLLHNGCLGALVALYMLAQQSKAVATLFDSSNEEAIGSGKFNPFSPSPEHCNAHSASLHELTTLARHYHPTVRTVVQNMMAETMHLPQEFSKKTPSHIFNEYDGSQLSFKPAIPPPKKQTAPKSRVSHAYNFAQKSLADLCEVTENSVKCDNVDFTGLYCKIKR